MLFYINVYLIYFTTFTYLFNPGYRPGQSTAVCTFHHHGGIRAEFGKPYTIAFQVKTRLTSTTIQTTAVCTFNHHGGILGRINQAIDLANLRQCAHSTTIEKY